MTNLGIHGFFQDHFFGGIVEEVNGKESNNTDK